MPTPDPAYVATEREIRRIEKRLAEEYKRAEREVGQKADDYFRRFKKKDATWQQWVAEGKKTEEEYKTWRTGQLAVGERWEAMRRELATDYARVNQTAREIMGEYSPGVYAENFNYTTYSIEHDTALDTGFTLYSKDAIGRIIRDNPKMLPDPAGRAQERRLTGKDIAYNEQLLQSAVIQGIMQGESISKIARRLEEDVGETDHASAIRNARTLMTSVQNAGRIDAMERANSMGIQTEKCWIATWDARTRPAHRELDGVTIPVEENFENSIGEIAYPGDPSADGANVWNCRCSLITQTKGFETDTTAYRDWDLEDMTYDEWKAQKRSTSNSITRQEEMGDAIRWAHIRNYRRG